MLLDSLKYLASKFDFSPFEGLDSEQRHILSHTKALLKSLPNPPTNGWICKRIGDVFKTASGGTPSTTHREYYEGGNIRWVNSGELKRGVILDTETKITELGLLNSSAKIFPQDTVLIAMYGATTGEVGILGAEASTNQAICGIFPNLNYAIPSFLFYLLKTRNREFKKMSRGVVRSNISQEIIKNFQIPLPPIETQQQILTVIQSLETVAQNMEAKMQNLESKKAEILDRFLNV